MNMYDRPKPARRFRRATSRVLEQVRWERYRQIEKGWTPEHDDEHTAGAMVEIAGQRIDSIGTLGQGFYSRERLIEGIAILVAAVEAVDRAGTIDRAEVGR